MKMSLIYQAQIATLCVAICPIGENQDILSPTQKQVGIRGGTSAPHRGAPKLVEYPAI